MLRRFFAANEDDDGLRIEKPSVPKTLRVGFRFDGAALVGVAGSDCDEETSSIADGVDDASFVASPESSSPGNGNFGALLLLLGFTHHVPIQSPKDGRSTLAGSSSDPS